MLTSPESLLSDLAFLLSFGANITKRIRSLRNEKEKEKKEKKEKNFQTVCCSLDDPLCSI
jgi:hypothetical protein